MIGARHASRYLLAAALPALCLLVVLVVDPPVTRRSPFFLFYAAVVVSSWYGGTAPGMLCTVVSAALVSIFVLEPRHTWRVDHPDLATRLVLFLLLSSLVAWLNGQLQRARRRAEAEARAARQGEARAKRLAESNLIAVFFFDGRGNVRWGNDAFLRLTGWNADDLRSGASNWRELTLPEHRHLDDTAMERLSRSETVQPYEKDHVLRDGRRLSVMMGCAVVERSERAAEYVGFLLDLTARKRAEEALLLHRQQLQDLGLELMRAEEGERRRIAAVLHDSIGHTLALAKRTIEAGQASCETGGTGVPALLTRVHDLVDEAITRARSLTSEVSPPVLYELGLGPALQWLGDRFSQEHGLECEFQEDERDKTVSDEVRLILFQGVRELLVNAIKHGGAHSCRIAFTREGADVKVNVTDDGRGFLASGDVGDEARPRDRGGFGLFNIRERLAHLGGRIEIDRTPSAGGASVTLVVPATSTAPRRVVQPALPEV